MLIESVEELFDALGVKILRPHHVRAGYELLRNGVSSGLGGWLLKAERLQDIS
jgi:hypothetical protein